MDGETRSLEAELLAHAAWMRRLAGHLMSDGAGADDAAQEAALAALEHRPRLPRRPRAWLSAVVRNAARRLGRAEGRRARREARAARPEALPSAAELAAEAEVQHALVAALLALAEPYRSTLVLRFYRGLEPGEIARLQGVPAGTVRSRLSRGLELVRGRLDERPGGRAAWSALMVPLVQRAPRPPPAAAAPWIAGGLAMGLKATLACAGAAAVAGAVYLAFRGQAEPPAEELASARAPETAALAAAEPEERAGAPAEAALAPAAGADERVALDPPAARGAGRLVRVVARDPDGEPVAGASIALSPPGRAEPVLARAVTDAEGRARVEPPADLGERARLAWDAPGLVGGRQEFDDLTQELELAFLWSAALSGCVRDAETGEPLAGAEIGEDGAEIVRAGPDGRYRLDGLVRGQRGGFRVRREGYVDRVASYLVNAPEGELDVELERGFALELLVYDRESGQPLAGAALAAYSSSPPFAATDAAGRATVRAAVGGEFALHVSAPGYCSLRWIWNVQAPPAEAEVQMPIPRAAAIEGRVIDGQGRPLAGAWLYARCTDERVRLHKLSGRQGQDLGPLAYAGYEASTEVMSDAEGRFRLEVVPCGETRTLTVAHSDLPSREVVLDAPLAPGETVLLDVQLALGGAVRGRVLENGAPSPGARVAWKDANGSIGGFARADEEGRYELKSVAAGVVSVVLFNGSIRNVLEEKSLSLEAGKTLELDFERTLETAEIRGRVTQVGAPLPGIVVAASGRTEGALQREFTATTDADGAYRLEVPAGQIFQVRVARRPAMRWRSDVPAGAVDVDFDLPALGTLRLRLVDAASGEPVRMQRQQMYGLFWRTVDAPRFEAEDPDPDLDGRQDLTVAAGEVDVLVHLADDGYAQRELAGVRVPAGGESEVVTLALERALTARLSFAGEGVAPADLRGHLLFLVGEAELDLIQGPFPELGGAANHRINGIVMRLERPTLMTQLMDVGLDGGALVKGLAPGRYHLRVYPDDFAFEPAAFELSAETPQPILVCWRRR